ncbi:hypothetical protein ABIB73_007206 [Bradyrhizobium sp. F1.4.3]|uniref:hypothetical protein n=1 Tax=Bradyrhizobium sp. F1.4.3 TaxID=3156356 RepID=UPI0033938461
MNRKQRIGLIVVVAAVVANYAPLLDGHAEQDNCTFGPVSNADYRAYLARAKSLLPFPTPSLMLGDKPFALRLDDLFDDLSGGETNIYSRLAIMHATLRAVGAEYRNTNGNDVDRGKSDAYVKATSQSSTVSFNYALDINRLWMFMPWPRNAWIIGSLAGPRYGRRVGPLYPKSTGDIRFIVWGPNILERSLDDAIRPEGHCPPVPAPELADGFSLRHE